MPQGPAPRRKKSPAPLRLLFPLFARYHRRLVVGFCALLGVDFLQLQIPRLLKTGVDSLSTGAATRSSLLSLAGLILLIGISVTLLRFCWRLLIIGFSRLVERDLREKIFARLLLMDRSFFSSWSTGDLMARSGNDLAAIQLACGMGMVAGVDALVMGVAAICFMLMIHVKLALIALLPMPFLAAGTKMLSSTMNTRFTRVQELFGSMSEFVRTALVSIRLIKGYCLEQAQERQFERLGARYVKGNLQVATVQGILHPLAMLTGNAGMLLVLYYGGCRVIEGTITLGDFVAFITYLNMLIWPMMAIGWVTNLMQRGLTSLARIADLFNQRPVLTSGDGKLPAGAGISFSCQKLVFSYPGDTRPVLRGIDVELDSGIIGLTGRAGAGKSTLCRLLARLYPVENGMLFCCGRDVNTLELETVRRRIGYVGQQVLLFSDTLYNNICFGAPDADRKEVEDAARAAGVHEDILGFSKGYETMIGEKGVKLSGGQRQRIALARALLSNRDMLIIDDGLSALDVETEQRVFARLRERYSEGLVLLVSHRVNLLRKTDRIIVLDEGRIIASGSHEQVYATSRLYRLMCDKQADAE